MRGEDSLTKLLIVFGLTLAFFVLGVWVVRKLWAHEGPLAGIGDARARRVGWAETEFGVGVMRALPSFVAIFGLGCVMGGVLIAQRMFPALLEGDARRWIRTGLRVLVAPILMWPLWIYFVAFHARPSWMVPPAYRREPDRR